MVFEEHLGVLDGVLGSYEDEGDVSLFPGHGGLRLVVAFDLHSHHTRLVNDFLPNVTCSRCGQLYEIWARCLNLSHKMTTTRFPPEPGTVLSNHLSCQTQTAKDLALPGE